MDHTDDLAERMLWLPSYGDCFYCSTWAKQVPAVYEFWFEVSGKSLYAPYTDPYTDCHTCCADCAAELWREETPDLRIVMARDLRPAGGSQLNQTVASTPPLSVK